MSCSILINTFPTPEAQPMKSLHSHSPREDKKRTSTQYNEHPKPNHTTKYPSEQIWLPELEPTSATPTLNILSVLKMFSPQRFHHCPENQDRGFIFISVLAIYSLKPNQLKKIQKSPRRLDCFGFSLLSVFRFRLGVFGILWFEHVEIHQSNNDRNNKQCTDHNSCDSTS